VEIDFHCRQPTLGGTVRRRLAVRSTIPIALLAVVCAAPTYASAGPVTSAHVNSPVVPGEQWQTVAPAAVGLDAAALNTIAATARTGKSNCLVVVRHGKLAGEWYFNGSKPSVPQDVFSVTKSLTSTLVGIAQDEGDLRTGDSAARWIDEWRGTPAQAVTVRDLLSNDSGREWSPAIDYNRLLRAADRTAFGIGLAQAQPPGQLWAYNNSAIQTLQRVLQRSTGQEVTAYAAQRVFGPLGMADTTMTRDLAGNAQMFEGLRSTCRDLARFGLLMLDRGRWGSQHVVSAGWVERATGISSTPLNAGYGYLWWLNRYGVLAAPLAPMTLQRALDPATARSRLVPGAPPRMFWAIGLGNQIIQVDPGSDTVVVRLGSAEIQPKPPTFGPAEASKVVTTAIVGR
jgi:CubicO group peptidase (beta-lactamase class C family)